MTLHPEIAKVLATLPAPPPGPLDPAAMRAGEEAQVPPVEERLPLHAVEDTTARRRRATCRCGSTRRSRPTPTALLVYFHGGAFFLGSLDTHDHVARSLAKETGLKVVSVGYRLAPEAAFPAGLEDCYGVVRWAAEQGDEPAAGTARPSPSPATARAATSSPPSPRWPTTTGSTAITHQVLFYPSLDLDFDVDRYASLRENAEGYGLETAGLKPFNAFYLDSGADPADPLVSPDQARGPRRPAAGAGHHRRARPAARRGRALRPAAAGGRRGRDGQPLRRRRPRLRPALLLDPGVPPGVRGDGRRS